LNQIYGGVGRNGLLNDLHLLRVETQREEFRCPRRDPITCFPAFNATTGATPKQCCQNITRCVHPQNFTSSRYASHHDTSAFNSFNTPPAASNSAGGPGMECVTHWECCTVNNVTATEPRVCTLNVTACRNGTCCSSGHVCEYYLDSSRPDCAALGSIGGEVREWSHNASCIAPKCQKSHYQCCAVSANTTLDQFLYSGYGLGDGAIDRKHCCNCQKVPCESERLLRRRRHHPSTFYGVPPDSEGGTDGVDPSGGGGSEAGGGGGGADAAVAGTSSSATARFLQNVLRASTTISASASASAASDDAHTNRTRRVYPCCTDNRCKCALEKDLTGKGADKCNVTRCAVGPCNDDNARWFARMLQVNYNRTAANESETALCRAPRIFITSVEWLNFGGDMGNSPQSRAHHSAVALLNRVREPTNTLLIVGGVTRRFQSLMWGDGNTRYDVEPLNAVHRLYCVEVLTKEHIEMWHVLYRNSTFCLPNLQSRLDCCSTSTTCDLCLWWWC
jgi:hypothetical protein